MRVVPYERPEGQERITGFKTDPKGKQKKVIKREDVKKKGLKKAAEEYRP